MRAPWLAKHAEAALPTPALPPGRQVALPNTYDIANKPIQIQAGLYLHTFI